MKNRFMLLLLYALAVKANAETLSLEQFSIDINDGWTYRLDEPAPASIDRSSLLSIYPANGTGELKMQTLTVGVDVDAAMVRRLTNLDSSVQLDWQTWDHFSGYQYSYIENNSFFKQWWLADKQTILLATYSADVESGDEGIEEFNKMIASIQFN